MLPLLTILAPMQDYIADEFAAHRSYQDSHFPGFGFYQPPLVNSQAYSAGRIGRGGNLPISHSVSFRTTDWPSGWGESGLACWVADWLAEWLTWLMTGRLSAWESDWHSGWMRGKQKRSAMYNLVSNSSTGEGCGAPKIPLLFLPFYALCEFTLSISESANEPTG